MEQYMIVEIIKWLKENPEAKVSVASAWTLGYSKGVEYAIAYRQDENATPPPNPFVKEEVPA